MEDGPDRSSVPGPRSLRLDLDLYLYLYLAL